jgi:hypothetical protein
VTNAYSNLNKKLEKIIDRAINLDRPILMHDKLDVIWEKEPTMKKTTTKTVWTGGLFHPEGGSSLTSRDPF